MSSLVSRMALVTSVVFAIARPALAAEAPAAPKPNIIFIFVDDQGYYDLGCYGATEVKTPRIDAIADEGIRFTDYYAAAPICSPSRAGLLTGCYPRRVGNHIWVHRADSSSGIHPDELTIAELFQQNGYATACIGKWHLGFREPFLPRNQGFDHYFGLLHNLDPVEVVYFGDQGVPLMRNDTIVKRPADPAELTKLYTDEAIAWGPGLGLQTGETSAAVVRAMDWYPSLATLAGIEIPAGPVIDGRDITPLLKGESAVVPAPGLNKSLNAKVPLRRRWDPPGEWEPLIKRWEYNDAFFYHGSQGALAAVRWNNWKLYLNPSLELYDLSKDPGGSQEEKPESYRLASPLVHVDKTDPPCWIITGEKDDPSTRADQFRQRLKELGIKSELTVVEGAPHAFLTRQVWFDEAMEIADQFFTKTLK